MRRISMFKISMSIFLMCFLYTAPGFSEIHVYDANDQYLGVLFGDGTEGYVGNEISIFMPELGLIGRFLLDGNLAKAQYFHFEAENCTGTPYYEKPLYPYLAKKACDDNEIYYFVTNNHKSFVPKSFINQFCECQKLSGVEPQDFIELSVFPKENFPFTLPVTLPLKLKYTTGGDINGDGKTGLEEAVNALQITSGLKSPGPPTGGTK